MACPFLLAKIRFATAADIIKLHAESGNRLLLPDLSGKSAESIASGEEYIYTNLFL
jgi:hypothetical protein